MKPPLSMIARPHSVTLIQISLFFLALLSTAQIAHGLFPSQIGSVLVWSPAGMALAGIILCGYGVWPAIILASLADSFLNGQSPFLLVIAVAVGNTVQALCGAWLLRKIDFETVFDRVRDAFSISLVAFTATTIVPTFVTLSLYVSNTYTSNELSSVWSSWWTGEILSVLILTPVLVRWLSRPRFRRTPLEWLEIAAAFGLLIFSDLLLFWTPYSSFHSIPLIYFILIPFTWLALRIGPRGITFAIGINALLALSGIVYGYSDASASLSLAERLFQGEIFIIIITVIYLILCAIAEERKQSAKALQEHIGRLEDAVAKVSREDEAKGRFIATLAHELRNPLAPLLSSLELLGTGTQTREESNVLVTQMAQYVRTMRHLLDDLLDISRISRNKLTLQKEHVDLTAIVHHSVRTVHGFITERDHVLSLELPEIAVLLEADPIRLEQILVNLLNNAAKYTKPGGQITLTVTISLDTVTIRVRDNGIGIPSTMIARIFEPFLQLENDTRHVSGLGIGLSLTKSLVEMHGGSIKAMSGGEGHGSEFIVTLPFINLASGTVAQEKLISGAIPSTNILVVDDNRPAADNLRKLLTLRGHKVQVAYDGTMALSTIKKWVPEIVLLDIGLPDIQGYEVAQRMRRMGITATIIALTGYGQDSDRRRAEAAGFNYHLTKPIALSELEEVFREANIQGRMSA